ARDTQGLVKAVDLRKQSAPPLPAQPQGSGKYQNAGILGRPAGEPEGRVRTRCQGAVEPALRLRPRRLRCVDGGGGTWSLPFVYLLPAQPRAVASRAAG